MSSTASDALRNKATQKELAGDLDAAFALYVQATQSYLHLSRTSNSPAARDLYKVSATRCLERAERIKATKRDLPLIKKNPFSPGTPWLLSDSLSLTPGSETASRISILYSVEVNCPQRYPSSCLEGGKCYIIIVNVQVCAHYLALHVL